MSKKFTVGKVAEEAGWEGGIKGISLAGNALTDKTRPQRAGRGRREDKGATEFDETLDDWENSWGHQRKGGASHTTKFASSEEIAQQRDALNAKVTRLNNPILHHTQRIDDYLNAELKKNNINARLDDYVAVNLVPSGGRSSPNTDGHRQPQPIVVFYKLRDMLTGTYLYDLNEKKDSLGRPYMPTVKGKYAKFIDNFDRTKLQEDLEKETDDYFTEEVKEERSGLLSNTVAARVIRYLDRSGEGGEFYQCVSDFYENKTPAKELYISGAKVPGFFCFTVGEGENAKTLVLNIYNDKSFVFRTEVMGREIPFVWNIERKLMVAQTMRFSYDWPAFNETVMYALPLFERFRYAKKDNPFKYDEKKGYNPISFQDGPYRNKLASTITDDIQERTKNNYDTYIYTNKERIVDVSFDLFRKYADLMSITASAGVLTVPGATMKALLILVTLGIDVASVGAISTQAYMADRPDKQDAMMKEAILETVFIGSGIVGDTAKAAVASYKLLKPIVLRGIKSLDKVDNLKSAKQLSLGDAGSATNSKASTTGSSSLDEAGDASAFNKGDASTGTDRSTGEIVVPQRQEKPASSHGRSTSSEDIDVFARPGPSTSSAVSSPSFPSTLEQTERISNSLDVTVRRYEKVALIAPAESNATTLMVNAHGGYYGKNRNPLNFIYDIANGFKRSPAIRIPDNKTVSFMAPHGKTTVSPRGNELAIAMEAKPYASINNKGVKIHNNMSDQTVNPAGSQSSSKAATGLSADENITGTMVRNTEHTEFINKYNRARTPEAARALDMKRNKLSVAQVFINAQKKGDVTRAADMLTINPGAKVDLETILRMLNEDPYLNKYNEVVMLTCRNKINTFSTPKTHHYKGTEPSNAKQAMKNTPTYENKMVVVRMVFIRNATTGALELKEIKELDEVTTLDTEFDEKLSLESQSDSSPDEASNMLKEFTDSSAAEYFDDIKIEMKSRVASGVKSLQAMKNVMIKNGYTNLRSRLIQISYTSKKITSYYAVVGTKNGQDFVIDGLAERSGLYGIEDMNTPLFLSENKWKNEYDAKLNGKASYKFTDTKLV
ncbi:putative adhesin [Serratia marcescens]|uniref:putative adhesin n=2 Tax=Serratia TaxID=613 RepID=UPI001BB0342F|nr:hypothetical protein [Serratia marcescens]